jgi:hypothetical protein
MNRSDRIKLASDRMNRMYRIKLVVNGMKVNIEWEHGA